MSVKELEKAIRRLPPDELARFREWFEEYVATQWDREFEADVKAGRLNRAGKQAERDFEEGRCTPL